MAEARISPNFGQKRQFLFTADETVLLSCRFAMPCCDNKGLWYGMTVSSSLVTHRAIAGSLELFSGGRGEL